MKVFIVFVGILMMAVSCLSYQGDAGRYRHDQSVLKAMAEDVACGSALCLRNEDYSNGSMIFDEEEAFKYTEKFIKENEDRLCNKLLGDIYIQMEYEDDKAKNGYSKENKECEPAVTVTLKASIEDAFRLPFIKVENITRKARYQIKNP